jgi:hypothetical protein
VRLRALELFLSRDNDSVAVSVSQKLQVGHGELEHGREIPIEIVDEEDRNIRGDKDCLLDAQVVK